MNHPYSAVLTYKAKQGVFPALKGELFEKDICIGIFSRGRTQDHFVPPIVYKFHSEAARNRFDSFADCLSIEETIESLLPL